MFSKLDVYVSGVVVNCFYASFGNFGNVLLCETFAD
jgi:hypothetical protein